MCLVNSMNGIDCMTIIIQYGTRNQNIRAKQQETRNGHNNNNNFCAHFHLFNHIGL